MTILKIIFSTKKLLLCTALLFLFACERELVVELPESPPRLVVYAFLQNGVPLEARISATRPALSNEPFVFPENALVRLYADGQLVDTLRFGFSDQGDPRYLARTVPVPGVNYTLRAVWEDLPETEATATLPGPVTVNGWLWDTTLYSNPDLGENSYLLDLRLDVADEPGSEDFYALRLAQIVQSFYTDAEGDTLFNAPDTLWVSLGTDMPGPTYGYPGQGLLFAEGSLINGTAHVFGRLAAADGYRRSKGFRLFFRRVDREHYLFQRDVFQIGITNDLSLFDEPVEVYNNMTGGFGNFSGVQQRIFSVQW